MEEEIAKLRELLAQKDELLNLKEEELASKNLELITKEAELISKTEELATKTRELAKRDDELELLKQQLAAMKKDQPAPQQLKRMASRSDSINNLASYFEKKSSREGLSLKEVVQAQAGENSNRKSLRKTLSQRHDMVNKETCAVCSKTVYLTERIAADEKVYHKFCFRCTHCNNVLKLGTFAALQGKIYCKPHFKQLFKEKGNYNEGFGEQKLTEQWAQRNQKVVS